MEFLDAPGQSATKVTVCLFSLRLISRQQFLSLAVVILDKQLKRCTV